MATSKKKVSLTRKAFFNELAVKPVSVDVGNKVVWVRPLSEVKRSTRSVEAFDDKGELRPDYMAKRRVISIVDQICDEDGNLLFTDADIPKLLELDSSKIDPFYVAIAEVTGDDLGNE